MTQGSFRRIELTQRYKVVTPCGINSIHVRTYSMVHPKGAVAGAKRTTMSKFHSSFRILQSSVVKRRRSTRLAGQWWSALTCVRKCVPISMVCRNKRLSLRVCRSTVRYKTSVAGLCHAWQVNVCAITSAGRAVDVQELIIPSVSKGSFEIIYRDRVSCYLFYSSKLLTDFMAGVQMAKVLSTGSYCVHVLQVFARKGMHSVLLALTV